MLKYNKSLCERWELYLILVVPEHVLWSPRQILPSAGEVDEAPGVDEKVRVPEHLDGGVW